MMNSGASAAAVLGGGTTTPAASSQQPAAHNQGLLRFPPGLQLASAFASPSPTSHPLFPSVENWHATNHPQEEEEEEDDEDDYDDQPRYFLPNDDGVDLRNDRSDDEEQDGDDYEGEEEEADYDEGEEYEEEDGQEEDYNSEDRTLEEDEEELSMMELARNVDDEEILVEEDFRQLCSMFPTYNAEDLWQLFDANSMDLERTIAILLELEEKPQEPSKPPVAVCKYFLKGKCFRADCWYSHNLEDMTCRYWLAGSCMKGASCEFRHGYDRTHPSLEMGKNSSAKAGQSTSINSFSLENFPRLQQAINTSRNKQRSAATAMMNVTSEPPAPSIAQPAPFKPSTPVSKEQMDMASRLKLQQLQQMFQGANKQVVEEIFCNQGCQFDESKRLLQQLYPDLDPDRKIARPAPSAPRSHPFKASGRNHSSAPSSKAPVGWLDTGERVGKQYMELRQEAIKHAQLRNRYYQEATQAYLNGYKSAAKELSQLGRRHHEEMKALHAEAGERIFAERNRNLPLLDKARAAPCVLDLHGLHVQEAVSVLEKKLQEQLDSRVTNEVFVITGTGHHSTSKKVNKNARLLPAVQRFLEAHPSYNFSDASPDNRGGMLRVTLRRT